MKTIHLLFLLLAFVTISGQTLAESKVPDLLIITNNHFGGWGRLHYNGSRFELVDGRINTYVLDGEKLRKMRPEETGGSMANPSSLVTLNNRIFSSTPSQTIAELDPQNGEIKNETSQGKLGFNVGSQPALFSNGKSLFVLSGEKVLVFDEKLKVLAEKRMDPIDAHVKFTPDFIMAGGELHDLEVDNPSTYTECAGNCKPTIVIRHTQVSLDNESKVEVKNKTFPITESFYFSHKAVLGKAWILVTKDLKTNNLTMEYRLFDKLARPAAILEMPAHTQVLATTSQEPLFMVLKFEGKYLLRQLVMNGKSLNWVDTPMDWIKGTSPSFALAAERGFLFVAADSNLVTYEIKNNVPTIFSKQEFVNSNGSSQLQISKMFPAQLNYVPEKLDRSRLERLVKKSFWNELDQLAISSDILKLTAQDRWAISLFTSVVKDKRSWHNGGMQLAYQALSVFGAEASDVLPILLKENLGSSYSEPQRSLSFELIKKIDPACENTLKLTKDNLNDSFKVRSTVELYEFIGAKSCVQLAKSTREKWQLH